MDENIYNLLRENRDEGIVLLDQKYGKLVRYIVSGILFGRKEDTEECVNDIYLKIWKNSDKLDPQKGSLKNYIAVIARNTALSRKKKINTKEEIEVASDSFDQLFEGNSNGKSLQDILEDKENVQRLKQLIMNLKGKEFELFMRKYFYMQSTRQISGSMKISDRAVESRLFRIREKLKKQYFKEK